MPKPKKMTNSREVGKEGAGSPGDVRDRFRGAYKPGARPAPTPGLKVPDWMKPKKKPKPKP